MTIKAVKEAKRMSALVAGLLGTVVMTASGSALADSNVTCAPTVVAYGSGVLNLICGGNVYTAQIAPGGNCTAYSADTLRGMLSLAQAAELSGKSVTLFFNSCTPTGQPTQKYLTEVDLIK